MAAPVDIYVSSDDAAPSPISGVTVVALTASNLTIAGEAITDSSGRAALLLPNGSYEIRLFKMGVAFNGVYTAVVDDVAVNVFDVVGSPRTMPVALDPRLCRCSGRFVGLNNQPVKNSQVRFSAKAESGFQTPKVVDGQMVSADGLTMKTDDNGYLTVDLLRGAELYVTFAGEEDVVWNIKVPDRASINLIELIHPQPSSLTWDSAAAPNDEVSTYVGYQVSVPMKVLFSDFEELSTGLSKWLKLKSSDPSVAVVAFDGDRAAVLGVSPGQASILVEMQSDLWPRRVPAYSISAPPLLVSVSDPPPP